MENQSQDGPTTRSELGFSARPASCPVAATRLPTCVSSDSRSGGSTSATDDDRLRRKPVRQLRDFGASTPSVSLNRNARSSSLISRQPVTVVTGGATLAVETAGGTGAATGGSAGSGTDATCALSGGASIEGDEARGADDGSVSSSRRATGGVTEPVVGPLARRVAASRDAAGDGALGTAAATAGLNATSAVRTGSAVCGAGAEPSETGERCGSAIAVATSAAAPARPSACRPVRRRAGGGCGVGATGAGDVAASFATRDRRDGARVCFDAGFAGCCLAARRFFRAPAPVPVSADTSSVRRTGRRAPAGGTLIAGLDMATGRAIHVPAEIAREFARARSGQLQGGHSTCSCTHMPGGGTARPLGHRDAIEVSLDVDAKASRRESREGGEGKGRSHRLRDGVQYFGP